METYEVVFKNSKSFFLYQTDILRHACGENPSRVYSASRMDSIWAFREAYNEARKIKNAQDEYCEKAEDGKWKGLGKWPEDLKWEALVDVLRGRVKVRMISNDYLHVIFILYSWRSTVMNRWISMASSG